MVKKRTFSRGTNAENPEMGSSCQLCSYVIRAQEPLHLASSRILLYNESSFLNLGGPIPRKTGWVFGKTRISSTDLCLRFSKLSSRTCLCLVGYVHAKIQSRDLFHESSRDDTRSQIQQRLPYVHCAPCPPCCNSWTQR